ncbi:MAG TPA: pyridoxal-phosphate dependent enzyme [Chitinophagaceae bacterium]|nr:pyridoxal-phosphate dependent enzyme [Chitinophagaceae bacterium]
MQEIKVENITNDSIRHPAFLENGIVADILRLDKIHPVISGNKWFKLKNYLSDFQASGKKEIITFGGAWSNHIVATASACKQLNIPVTGIIRGEASPTLSKTLIDAKNLGMHLHFASRTDYKNKLISGQFNNESCYIIPEGGYGHLGMLGAATILELVNKNQYTHVCCAAGTGTMAAGLLHKLLPEQHLEVVSVLKNFSGLEASILFLNPVAKAVMNIHHNFHFGGYAKHKPELIAFMNKFYNQTKIPSDFVYSAKMIFAITDLAYKNYFPPQSRLLLIHCGGLQGNASLDKGSLIF